MANKDIDLSALSSQIKATGETWQCGETSMTQLSLEDARARLGFVPPPGAPSLEDVERALRNGKPQAAFTAAAAVGAPPAYDLRNVGGQSYVTPIRDQANCGSCVAFGVVSVLESTLRVSRQDPALDVNLSEAHLFFCHGRSQGRSCATGWEPGQALDQCASKGLAFEQSYPYAPNSNQDCSGLDAAWQARYATVSGKRQLSGAAIKEWIATRGPVTACFIVYNDFFAYRSGVYRHVSGAQAGGHCVSIVGYDDAQSCWICKNSWGTGWGEAGFFRIGYGECGIDTWYGPYGAEGVSIAERPKAWSGWYSEGGVLTSDIAVDNNADGRLEMFVRGSDNALWHNWQVAPNSSWSGWSSLEGVISSPPSVGRNADGRLEVFACGTDGAVWHRWQMVPNGDWAGWVSLGGVITSNIAIGKNQDGRLEIFVRGTDGAVWHQWQVTPNGDWSGWYSLGGVITSQIAVDQNADGRLEIFARGTDGAVWHQWQVTPNGGWSGWYSLGGVITSDIGIGRNADGRLEIFARGTDNALWHQWQVAPNGTWSGWYSLSGLLTSNIAVGRSPGGRLEVFVRGTDNALWHKWQVAPNSGWSEWASEGGVLTSNIAVASNQDGRLELFVRGTDNALWHDWQTRPFTAVRTEASEQKAPRSTRAPLAANGTYAEGGA